MALPVVLSSCGSPAATPQAAPGPLDAVVAVVYDRLATSDLVAAAKWATKAAVEDPGREQAVLDAATQGAASRGLDAAAVADVFRDQIQASKVVQYGLLEDWTAEPAQAPQTAPDLTTTVRPVLDGVTPRLLDALAGAAPVRKDGTCAAQLRDANHRVADAKSLDELHRRALERALRSVCA